MRIARWGGVVLLMISCRIDPATLSCAETACRYYLTQGEAQEALKAEPTCRAALDQDKDGTACEEPGNETFYGPSSMTGGGSSGVGGGGGSTTPYHPTCPTTAACGCSGFKKAQCGGSCCAWCTGQGCGCR